MRRCARCGEEKPESEFGWKNKEQTHLHSYCRPCVRANSKDHYEANKRKYISRTRRNKRRQKAGRLDFIVRYLEEHPCVDCGETDPLVLEFDHLRDKSFNIGHEYPWRPWELVLAEIAKCEVRCANCHRRRTAERGGFLRLLMGQEQ
jgi:hypothetical protein